MKVYVASSWRNEQRQQEVVQALRAAGHEVYDFRHPAPGNDGFSWKTVHPNWQQWSPPEYLEALRHPVAVAGFRLDMSALLACDACVLVQPCGSSAHLELGHAVGAGKFTVALLAEGREAELMLAMVDKLALCTEEVVAAINAHGLSTRSEVYLSAATRSGGEPVEAVARYKGLAVTGAINSPGRFQVTHEATGYALTGLDDFHGLAHHRAVSLMLALGDMTNWRALDVESGKGFLRGPEGVRVKAVVGRAQAEEKGDLQ